MHKISHSHCLPQLRIHLLTYFKLRFVEESTKLLNKQEADKLLNKQEAEFKNELSLS